MIVSVRMSEEEIKLLKKAAQKVSIPYTTFISLSALLVASKINGTPYFIPPSRLLKTPSLLLKAEGDDFLSQLVRASLINAEMMSKHFRTLVIKKLKRLQKIRVNVAIK